MHRHRMVVPADSQSIVLTIRKGEKGKALGVGVFG